MLIGDFAHALHDDVSSMSKNRDFVGNKICSKNLSLHVLFGKVIQGFEIIRLVEDLKTDSKGKPESIVTISHSGELIIKIKSKSIYFCMHQSK